MRAAFFTSNSNGNLRRASCFSWMIKMNMQISISDLLASLALVVSVASAYYTSKQSEYARFSSRNDYRAYLSDNHKRYREILANVQEKHRENLSMLCRHAGRTLTEIVHLFDEYNIGNHTHPYLRHLIHESSEMVYHAFKGQLGWQTGLNISGRFYRFLNVEDHLEPTTDYSGSNNYRRSLWERYRSDVNAYQEVELLNDLYFANLVTRAKNKISVERSADLLFNIQEIFKPFREMYDELQPSFLESANELEKVLEEGEMEHFPLDESPKIFNAIRYRKATLNTLAHLVIPATETEHFRHIRNFTSYGIYICALLHAIQDHHCWGWREYRQE